MALLYPSLLPAVVACGEIVDGLVKWSQRLELVSNFSSLPNNKILDLPKFKAFVKDKWLKNDSLCIKKGRKYLTLYQTKILDLSKLKEIADDNFKLDENGRELSKCRKHCEKSRNCWLRAISLFPTCFQET